MIPEGREVVTREQVGALHGMSPSVAAKARPHAKPQHPQPLNAGRRPQLWDFLQAKAFADGQDVPQLPTGERPGDLLDRFEAAALVGVAETAWEQDFHRNRTPVPDARPGGVAHWRRDTCLAERRRRQQPAEPGGGRPKGSTDGHCARGAELSAEVRRLAAMAADRGEKPNVAAIARDLGIHYTTAHKYAKGVRNVADKNAVSERAAISPGRLRRMRWVAAGQVQRRATEAGQVWEIAGSDAGGEDKKALRWLDKNGLLEFGGFGGGTHQAVGLSVEGAELLREEESRDG